MTRVALCIVVLLVLIGAARRTQSPASEPSARFTSVDLFVDPRGQPLAAYQLECLADPSRVTLVGVEGGEHPAFREPPYYDPAALSGNRVILAAQNTGIDRPSARTRVATLHRRVVGGGQPTDDAKREVEGNRDGTPVAADVTVGQGVK